jgi:hypothetical protein
MKSATHTTDDGKSKFRRIFMLKKLVYALALTGLASGQAFALSNPGFEAGTTAGWLETIPVTGLMTAVGYGTPAATVNVVDDIYVTDGAGNVVPTTILSRAVTAVSAADLPGTVGAGNYFGLVETCAANIAAINCPSATTFSFNLGGPVSTYGDYFLARMFTADFAPNYNDTLTINYFGASSASALATDVVSVQTMIAQQGAASVQPDSGWQAFGVPVGTQSITIKLENVAIIPYQGSPTDNLYNRPIVAIDYAAAVPVTPVPEADASAMMLAGLSVLGLVARRRAKKAA